MVAATRADSVIGICVDMRQKDQATLSLYAHKPQTSTGRLTLLATAHSRIAGRVIRQGLRLRVHGLSVSWAGRLCSCLKRAAAMSRLVTLGATSPQDSRISSRGGTQPIPAHAQLVLSLSVECCRASESLSGRDKEQLDNLGSR